jgi:hypothetical protein
VLNERIDDDEVRTGANLVISYSTRGLTEPIEEMPSRHVTQMGTEFVAVNALIGKALRAKGDIS